MSENFASKSNPLSNSKSDDEELDILRKAALKTISSSKQHQPPPPPQLHQHHHHHPRPTLHNMENNPYNNYLVGGDYRRHNNFLGPGPGPRHPYPTHPSLPPHHMQQQPLQQPPFYNNPPMMQPRLFFPVQQPQLYGLPSSHQIPPTPGNQMWDRDYNSAATAIFSPGASLVPTNVQLSPRSQAFVAENNDILLKRKGDRFLRRSRSKSWSRSPSPHGRSSYKNGRRYSPRKRSMSNSSGESPGGRKYSRKNPRPTQSPKKPEDQKKEASAQPRRRGGSPILFSDEKKKDSNGNSKEKEAVPQKITLNRNRIIKLNSTSKNNSVNNANARPIWNRNGPHKCQPNKTSASTKEEEVKKDEKNVAATVAPPSSTTEDKHKTQNQTAAPVSDAKKVPAAKPPRQKTAEELMEEELLRSDDELDDGILLTNDDLDIDDLFESESESENEGRFKSKSTTAKDSPLSFSKLGEKPGSKIRPLDDVIDKNKRYDKSNKVGSNFIRKSGQNDKDKKSDKKPLEFRKLSLDRKKSYDKEPPRKVIIGRSSGNNGSTPSKGDEKPLLALEKKSIYSRLGGKALDGLDNKREKV